MEANDDSLGLEPQKMPYGKVMGIVESRDQFQVISAALIRLDGVHDVEALEGPAGIEILEPVCERFYGDIESRMIHRYLEAVKNGEIVVAASVEPKIAEEVAETVKAGGASEIAHFGNWVVTNY